MNQSVQRMQDRLYHDLILPVETQEIRTKAREFADRVVAPRAYASNRIAAVYDVHCILAGHALEYGSELAVQDGRKSS